MVILRYSLQGIAYTLEYQTVNDALAAGLVELDVPFEILEDDRMVITRRPRV